ncbi:tectonin beta-propeller repeat-containing protein 1-like [Elysia marginata]|uniref:Tectonin beta-propeller repeat-containing protein 1-like n=1 Tax=Elysia marginata TaxID=1093978 RepID=A0AAV4EXW7_9GAST|nr:tectonin beta-propeller repeat-containing protein 1-like [Elysia marginata]
MNHYAGLTAGISLAQRWSPFYGFSKKSMLRSDRHAWSDETGNIERPKESVRLPSSHWEWDGDWMIDDNLRGEVVELGGWQYALDFPAVYTPEQHWNSFVRRRKWIHFRRFFATDCWANISDMEMVENSECIIDISVGGFLLPSQPDGFLAVWAVMNSGSVYVRTNVHRENPEGSAWRNVSLEKYHGIINISVGATNLVWAVTWDGQALVRTKVSRSNIYGSSWMSVESPDRHTQLMQVAVGRNAVWALSRDYKVWFRKGTWGDHTFWSHESAVGSLWVEMIGEMSQIALSSNDQVFAIDTAGQNVYFRTAVSSHDLTGKTWQKVTLREDLSQFRDLGILGMEDDGSTRAPSESTSCSSISLSTAASSSAIMTDDFSSPSDVFMSPLSPSQPADFSRMLSIEDHFPPAWSLGDGDMEVDEENEPETPTTNQNGRKFPEATQHAASEESHSESPHLLSMGVSNLVPDAELLSPELNTRVRSVSQYSLTDSLPHSSRTISPASSMGTVQLGLTRSVSSQTDGNSIELSSEQVETSQTSIQQELNCDADALLQSSPSSALGNNQNSKGESVGQENLASFSSNCAIRGENNVESDHEKTEDAEGLKLPNGNPDNISLTESNTDLTEVDRHLKTLTETNISHEDQAQDMQVVNAVKMPQVTGSICEPMPLSHDAAEIKGNDTKSKPSNNVKSCTESREDNQSAPTQNSLLTVQPQPITQESSLSKDNAQGSLQHLNLPNVSLSNENDNELVKKRSSKSRRHSSSSRKSDPVDENDAIVFKTFRRKKQKNRKKSKDIAETIPNDSDLVSAPDTGESSLSISQTKAEESQEQMKLNEEGQEISRASSDKSVEKVSSELLPTAVDNLCNDVAPFSLHNPSVPISEISENQVDTSEIENKLVDVNATTAVFIPRLRFEIKNRGLNDNKSQEISSTQCDQNVSEPDFNQGVKVFDVSEFSELSDSTKSKTETTMVGAKQEIDSVKLAQVNGNNLQPIGKSVKENKYPSVSISCQTEGLEFQPSYQKSPKSGKKKLPPERVSPKSCPMTKLTPSVKKHVTTIVALSTKKADYKTKNSGSESDEIADFVTDLLSEEESETEENLQEKEEESFQSEGKDRDDGDVKVNRVSDVSSSLLADSGPAEQGVRAPSVTSVSSASSSADAKRSVTRKMSGSVRNSPSMTSTSSLQLKQSAFYRQTPSPARLSSPSSFDLGQMPDSLPSQAMVVAQPRLSWKWLDATSCIIDDSSKVEWLSNRDDASHELKPKISKLLRDNLLKKIVARNKSEVVGFTTLETAVEKSTWVQKANMQMLQHGRQSRWIACSVELEQGIGASEKGTLTVHYSYRRKQRHTQLQLSDMTCVKMNTDPDLTTAFSVFTPDLNLSQQPLMLKASSEKEAADWLDFLSSAKASAWNLNRPIPPGAIWSCSFTGDVLVSCDSQDNGKPYLRCWGLHGGHMALIETSPAGVTWGLGFDKMPHVYNGGYGGAVCTGQSSMSDNTQQMVDSHRVYVYENQKWFPVVGWCNKGVFHHNFHWVTSSGQFVTSRDQVKLPSSKWNWISDWTIDFSTVGGVDSNGWQYSKQFNGSFHQSSHIRDHYRRRRWVRRCRISLMGPWTSAGSLGISDLSIQPDPVESPSEPIVMWAVATNGDVLCRYGVTQANPMGQSWVHISRDQDKPFTSISVGSRGQVWGVATDGSAWYRTGVHPENPTGKHWLQVVPPPPGSFRLCQVSAGTLAVWAVDTGDNLWRRENITPTFPEGTGWESIASKVKRVSVGPQDQSGWAHVSVRGMAANLGNADSGIEES